MFTIPGKLGKCVRKAGKTFFIYVSVYSFYCCDKKIKCVLEEAPFMEKTVSVSMYWGCWSRAFIIKAKSMPWHRLGTNRGNRAGFYIFLSRPKNKDKTTASSAKAH